jgi:hypothetical protein
MQLISRLKKVEDAMEKDVETFFTLVGANETPEEWGSCEQQPMRASAPEKPIPAKSPPRQ